MFKQTTFKTADAMVEGNKSLPFGIVAMVRACFSRLGLYTFFDRFKERGVPLGYVLELMCIHQLSGGASMNKCGMTSDSVILRSELCHGFKVTRKTMERALSLLDLYFEETTVFIWERIQEIYPMDVTDVYVDGSHVERYGSKGALTAVGEGGGTLQLQDQFMVARLVDPALPFMIEAYPGNWNDPPQYGDFIPQLMFLLKKGSMIIMDNGGSSKDLLDEIRDRGMKYITRVKMNDSDDKLIDEHRSDIAYVGRMVACLKHRFESSGKTNYLFFSADRYCLGSIAAERRASKMAEDLKDARDVMNEPKMSKLLTVKKNPFYKVVVSKYEVMMTLDPWLDEDILKAAKAESGERCGWFKLQCSEDLEPSAVLDLYRHRVGIEHLISSIKSLVKLKPLRVWSESSVRGSLLLAMIAQLTVSMVRQDLEPDIVVKRVDGKDVRTEHRPSEKEILENLVHWTVTLIPREDCRIERVFSNETELTRRVSSILDGYEGVSEACEQI